MRSTANRSGRVSPSWWPVRRRTCCSPGWCTGACLRPASMRFDRWLVRCYPARLRQRRAWPLAMKFARWMAKPRRRGRTYKSPFWPARGKRTPSSWRWGPWVRPARNVGCRCLFQTGCGTPLKTPWRTLASSRTARRSSLCWKRSSLESRPTLRGCALRTACCRLTASRSTIGWRSWKPYALGPASLWPSLWREVTSS